MMTIRRLFPFALALLTLFGGCARMPSTGLTTLKPATMAELQDHLRTHKADLELFRLRGPFAVNMRKDYELHLSGTEVIKADLFLSSPAEKAPLVILLHGLDNSKDNHGYQGTHLATWGIHCLVLQLPNQGPWDTNGKTVARIATLIYRQPEIIDSRIDASKIILAGHSYGGAAIAIALAEGAPAAGGILLDPAGTDRNLPNYLRRVNKPVVMVAADEHVSRVRDRGYFYQFIRSGIAEVSIRDAAHEDATYPLELDSSTTEALQITFVSALTSASFSLAMTGKLDYAWTSFRDGIENGKLVRARKK
jgi:pimeloyl-ACP methyl ester carboxylesterase